MLGSVVPRRVFLLAFSGRLAVADGQKTHFVEPGRRPGGSWVTLGRLNKNVAQYRNNVGRAGSAWGIFYTFFELETQLEAVFGTATFATPRTLPPKKYEYRYGGSSQKWTILPAKMVKSSNVRAFIALPAG